MKNSGEIAFQQNYNVSNVPKDVPRDDSKKVWQRLKESLDEEEKMKLLKLEKEMRKGIPFEDTDEIIEEARKIIPPVLSVPKKYYKEIKNKGFVEATPSWTGHRLIAAVLGRSPYAPKNEDRIYFSLSPRVRIEPRFMVKNKTREATGKINKDDALFHGVVLVSDSQKQLRLDHDLKQIN